MTPMSGKIGRFIAIEGVNGAGTTTHAKTLVQNLSAAGIPAVFTFEPTNGPIGALIRGILSSKEVVPEEELAAVLACLFTADRRIHAATIRKQLDAGIWVVSDRYYLSTLVYQGSKISPDIIRKMHLGLQADPDMTIILDAPLATCMKRVADRSATPDIFEGATDFMIEAHNRYLLMGAVIPHSIIIPTDGPMEVTANAVVCSILTKFRSTPDVQHSTERNG